MHLEACLCSRMILVRHFSDVAYSGINFTSITMVSVDTGLWKCDSHDHHEELLNVALQAHSADIADATGLGANHASQQSDNQTDKLKSN